MTTKTAILLILLFACKTLIASDKLQPGVWEVAQITIDKNTDGRRGRNTHKKAAEVQSYVRCPQKWEVTKSDTIVQYYDDGTAEKAVYTLEGNKLMIFAPAAIQTYEYAIDDEKLTLNITHTYYNNLHTGKTERIEEKWTIVLQKNNNE